MTFSVISESMLGTAGKVLSRSSFYREGRIFAEKRALLLGVKDSKGNGENSCQDLARASFLFPIRQARYSCQHAHRRDQHFPLLHPSAFHLVLLLTIFNERMIAQHIAP